MHLLLETAALGRRCRAMSEQGWPVGFDRGVTHAQTLDQVIEATRGTREPVDQDQAPQARTLATSGANATSSSALTAR